MNYPLKLLVCSYCLAWVASFSQIALAAPTLSDDASAILGVEVNGGFYDVYFGDDLVGNAYDVTAVSTTEWSEFSNALSNAVSAVIGPMSYGGTLIKGCSDPYFCIAFIPDGFADGEFVDLNLPAFYRPELDSPADLGDRLFLTPGYDTGSAADITLVTVLPSSARPAPADVHPQAVPIPAPFYLAMTLLLLVVASVLGFAPKKT